MYRFALEHVCAQSGARAATIETAHGVVQTPIFMPVATQAAVKAGVLPHDLREIGVQILLANTYHLMLRPGSERIRQAGGLHRFMAWERPILTDSGGFQVYSLRKFLKVSDDGVVFSSHIDGSRHHLDAERAMALQEDFGSDIAMAFDQCPPARADQRTIELAMRRTTAWLDRCLAARKRPQEVALYGIVQGGVDLNLRSRHVDEICTRDRCEGFAIGGLSVGESTEEMYTACAHTLTTMPADKARYLMGVGTPSDILSCIGFGVDQFDCVMPSRDGRHGKVETSDGRLNIKNKRFFDDDRPLDPNCDCSCCRQFSRSYIRHLFSAKEILAATLMTIHNLHFYLRMSAEARAAILEDRYGTWSRQQIERQQSGRWRADGA